MYVDRLEAGDIEVPERPSQFHELDGTAWVENIESYNDSIRQQRASRYRTESDPIKIEAEYDAMFADVEPDYTRWIEAVKKIKNELQYK
jgi:uncharacterized Zn finger protein